MAHLFVAAAHKSSGKTSLSVGLTAALAGRGLAVQPFKKGPDYIDPIWLARAAGRPCYNLDFFTQSTAEIKALFAKRSAAADISVIEGNKGLFDGLAVDGADSNAALAALLAAPVVLVIDCTGITRGVAPLLRGYLGFEPQVDIRGVILNKVGGARHESKLRAALERYTDIEVLGVLGRDSQLEIPERHLGLIPANEVTGSESGPGRGAATAERMIARLARAVAVGVDLDRIMDVARAAGPRAGNSARQTATTPARTDVRIAIARDAAFGFYYPDDLEAFAAAGAELVPFDALCATRLPEADGLFIGGGFPETQLAALSANRGLMQDIHRALAAGLPAYAECGGLMYLAKSIRWRGEQRDMVGAVPADIVVGDRPQGRGYMLLEETPVVPWPPAHASRENVDRQIPAHEFHYARLENLPGNLDYAWRVARGSGIDGIHDGIVIGNLLAGFAHHRNTAADPWVERFVSFVREKSR
jgi:cobyrinic acid a,c-diamide synthase